MHKPNAAEFPCPFCQSSRVLLIGGSLVFLHHRCDECGEVWTVTAMPMLPTRPSWNGTTEPTIH